MQYGFTIFESAFDGFTAFGDIGGWAGWQVYSGRSIGGNAGIKYKIVALFFPGSGNGAIRRLVTTVYPGDIAHRFGTDIDGMKGYCARRRADAGEAGIKPFEDMTEHKMIVGHNG